MSSDQRIGAIGAGAWGTALANMAARAGHHVTLYDSDPMVGATIQDTRTNPRTSSINA